MTGETMLEDEQTQPAGHGLLDRGVGLHAWADVAPTVVTVRAGKTRAAARRVPLSPYARALLEVLGSGRSELSAQNSSSVFALSTSQVDALFRKARARCGIEDLHWHDARATAITRLARRLDILDLARMIGHANLGELRT